MESNFEKVRLGDTNDEGTEYDLKSIMQYGRKAFISSHTLEKTMENKFDANMPLGGTELSPIDIVELNRHYRCSGIIICFLPSFKLTQYSKSKKETFACRRGVEIFANFRVHRTITRVIRLRFCERK